MALSPDPARRAALHQIADTNVGFEVGEMVALQVNGAEHELRNAQPWPSPADPGDLSRRIVQRRTELKLSVAQVAERARISRRYLEYLESFPARPSTVTL